MNSLPMFSTLALRFCAERGADLKGEVRVTGIVVPDSAPAARAAGVAWADGFLAFAVPVCGAEKFCLVVTESWGRGGNGRLIER